MPEAAVAAEEAAASQMPSPETQQAQEEQQQQRFIPSIAQSLCALEAHIDEPRTSDFVSLIDKIILVFDHLGPVLMFARQDMHSKAESLREVAAGGLGSLREVVEADKAAGLVTKKNSKARNLHRLTAVLRFMRLLLSKMMEGSSVTLKDAANFAYEGALAPIHPYAVRTAVWAGMYILPSRQTFLQSIGETEDSARGPAVQFAAGAEQLENKILGLFDVEMPASDAAPSNMFGSWWSGGAAAPAPAPA